MKLAAGLVALVALVGCSVAPLSLEGKQCPCVEAGFVCDKVTNRCIPTNDGGGIIDTPAATQCLPTVPETEIYRYTGTFDWQHADASWMGGTEITQTSNSVQNSYAFKTSSDLAAAHDVHVISSMRQVQAGGGEPALGIALRVQLDAQNKSHYACMWTSKSRQLSIQVSDGGNPSILRSIMVPGMAALPTTFTMEAAVTGSLISCCIREIDGARLSGVMDTSLTDGYPGLQTTRMAAAFGSFVVLKPN